jgi:hypothetical protein
MEAEWSTHEVNENLMNILVLAPPWILSIQQIKTYDLGEENGEVPD